MLKIENATGGCINTPVLKNISFKVGNGELIGLVGLDEAGKSTTVNEIIGLSILYQGQISIDDLTLARDQAEYRRKTGFIPETPNLYEELTLRERLETVVMAYDPDYGEAMARAAELLGLFRLSDKLKWSPINFPEEMRQKVVIIYTFMINPSLFIVDGPFLRLDPLAISDLTGLSAQEKAKEKMISMSAHVLGAAERMCDHLVILHQGQIHATGTLAELREASGDETATPNDIYMPSTKGV